MLDDAELQEVVDYVLADIGKRLELAIGIHAAFDKLRGGVIGKFSRELVDRLQASLSSNDGWEVVANALFDRPFEQYTRIEIRKREWDEGVSVQLCADGQGPRDWWFGVATPKGYPRADAIRRELTKDFGNGRGPNDGYPWWRNFEGEWGHWTLADWRSNQAVLALGKGGSGPYGTYLHDRLIEIARSAERALRPEEGESSDTDRAPLAP